jgi:replicative superfamily II helicase
MTFEQASLYNLLERIATTLERIEIVLEEKQNKTQTAKECRELMQNICKYYKQTESHYDIQVGSRLHIHRFRDAIAKIKNTRNTKFETKKLYAWVRKLEDHEFIQRDNSDMLEVLDTGQSWWD